MIYVKNKKSNKNFVLRTISFISGIYAVSSSATIVTIYITFGYLFGKFEFIGRKIISFLILFFAGVFFKSYGKIEPDTQMIIINHRSFLDIIVMELLTKKNIAWVAKKELFQVPFFSHLLKIPQGISIDRENSKSIVHLLRESKKEIARNRLIVIFPEGTRNSDPEKELIEFKKGAEIVANKLNLKVQPIVINHTDKRINSSSLFHSFGKIEANILEQFQASKSNGDWLEKEKQKMRKVYLEVEEKYHN
jgi:1-acyl-sn-glycerol-3-phosphate acyltransferase